MTRNIEGTGLGIAIVQKLLGMMKSKLEVVSEYGHGSEFSFKRVQKIIDRTPLLDYVAHEVKSAANGVEKRYLTASGAKMLTASAMAGMREIYLLEGFDDYLSKPIEVSELESVLERHFPAEMVSFEVEQHTDRPVEASESPVDASEALSTIKSRPTKTVLKSKIKQLKKKSAKMSSASVKKEICRDIPRH